jgi:hypothetical protein
MTANRRTAAKQRRSMGQPRVVFAGAGFVLDRPGDYVVHRRGRRPLRITLAQGETMAFHKGRISLEMRAEFAMLIDAGVDRAFSGQRA